MRCEKLNLRLTLIAGQQRFAHLDSSASIALLLLRPKSHPGA
jgi:hypothetical protein